MRKTIFACALWPSFFIVVRVLLLLSCPVKSVASRSETPPTQFATDRAALLSFKSFIRDDPLGALSSWNNASLHFCQWRGVRCRLRNHQPRVTALRLGSLGLAGSISPSLSNLTVLQRLHLPENRLRGVIPQELGLLSRLRHLNLSYNPLAGGKILVNLVRNCSRLRYLSLNGNNLHGAIPRSIGRCSQLELIGLTDNMLEGGIPSQLGSLSKLKVLSLWNNSLSGRIPPAIGNLAELIQLNLQHNQLTASVPAAIGNLTSLTHVDLSYNYLAGGIPSELMNITTLTTLYLDDNQLTGAIPAAVGNLSSLALLDLSNNQLTGGIPSEIGNLVPLTLLYLSGNQLAGTIPSEIGNLGRLRNLDFSSNFLVGTIPSSLGSVKDLYILSFYDNNLEAGNDVEWGFLDALSNCTKLRALDLSRNYLAGMLPRSIANLSTTLERLSMITNDIAGSIPAEIVNLAKLSEVWLSSNLLGGPIPATLGSLPSLQRIALEDNKLTGEIPAALGNLTGLSILLVSSNELHGPIPLTLARCPLNTLDLSFNKLSGTLPKEILSISTLTVFLNVSSNSLTGPLPPQVGNLKNVRALDVSKNKLSGEVPGSIGGCEVLQYLRMEENLFDGPLPPSFSGLKGLQELDVSRNNLSGSIPSFFGRFPFLRLLNISFNNFEGEIPRDGIFRNARAFSFAGNNKLCGGVRNLKLPPCSFHGSSTKKKHTSPKLIAIISAAAGTVCLVLLFSSFCALRWILKSKRETRTMTSIGDRYKKVSYAELLRATDGFSTANLIGAGGYGSVYKGFMNGVVDGYDVVAVKVFNLQQRGSSRSFIAECDALRNIRHRNLVKILTACASIDFRGNDFKALVYQFLPNGNLDQWLHPDAQGPTRRTLSLTQRLNILMDVACALDYLHHQGPDPIVHCDIKPRNILLDNDMVAHVGDFGLARILNRVPITEAQRSSSSMILKGTIGYVAPEYGVANKASTEGDVYSYGIVVLEMFTGKKPTDVTAQNGLSLPRYVEMTLPERVADIMDANLQLIMEEGDEEEAHQDMERMKADAVECIISILRIGIECTKESPPERMQMKDVIGELVAIRSTLFRHKVQGGRRVAI
ncbi:unnamed protein product [Musa acuminata var. zebrina]